MLSVKQFVFNHFQTNCYVLWDEKTHECAIIDPCMVSPDEERRLSLFVTEKGLKVVKLLLTHAHVDHVAGLRWACTTYDLPVVTHRDSQRMLRQAEAYDEMMGFNVGSLADIRLEFADGGDEIRIGEEALRCRYVPGHCIGSLCFVAGNPEMVFTGDALFRGSIGRTDLPGGNHEQLIEKIRTELLTLDDSCIVLPGHGESSTIEEEKAWNPFL